MDLSWRGALLVAAGGAVGALARYGVGAWLTRDFPYGTMAVNAFGSFLLAWFMFGGIARGWFGPEATLWFGIGALGAFTTMSTFAYDTLAFVEAGDWTRASWNVALNPILALAAAYLGLVTARTWPGGG